MAAVISDGLGKARRIPNYSAVNASKQSYLYFLPSEVFSPTRLLTGTLYSNLDLHRRYLAYSQSAFAGCDITA